LLEKWNRVYNLTAVRDAERMVSHHLLDSLAAVPFFQGAASPPLPNPLPQAGEGANVMPKPIHPRAPNIMRLATKRFSGGKASSASKPRPRA